MAENRAPRPRRDQYKRRGRAGSARPFGPEGAPAWRRWFRRQDGSSSDYLASQMRDVAVIALFHCPPCDIRRRLMISRFRSRSICYVLPVDDSRRSAFATRAVFSPRGETRAVPRRATAQTPPLTESPMKSANARVARPSFWALRQARPTSIVGIGVSRLRCSIRCPSRDHGR